ncbi:hypothetical protein M422DRAFT_266411 [Sphaerobolus stellatus SS14]|uniref:DUF5648 domain-containing protein n=1 Tax=Sphaerobolus stellatus (strain SS14) TaxID=990650 RepID=A0A0C9UBE0_SPHS4|nr:hypothetical protein M422DRAFT_266411 [Sphaerobolus stellatus SS14]
MAMPVIFQIDAQAHAASSVPHNILFILITGFAMGHISGWCMDTEIRSAERRATDTCGDPSVATTFYEAFSPSLQVHTLNLLVQFVGAQTVGQDWQIISPSFNLWISPGQLSTTPLWVLPSLTTSDAVFLTSTNGTTPTRNGFSAGHIVGYVYPTQICGSVPLYAAALPSDHWYTTNLIEHNVFISDGWTDDGIIAYVLPVDGTAPEGDRDAEIARGNGATSAEEKAVPFEEESPASTSSLSSSSPLGHAVPTASHADPNMKVFQLRNRTPDAITNILSFGLTDKSPDKSEVTAPESPSQQLLEIPHGNWLTMTTEAEHLNTLELTLAEEHVKTKQMENQLQCILELLNPTRATAEPAPSGEALSVNMMDEDTQSEMSAGRGFQMRPSNPSDFDGDHEKGQAFLNSCNLYFSIAERAFQNEQACISWALTFFKTGQAASFTNWVLRTQTSTRTPHFADWKAFELEFRKRFMPRNKQVTTITQLEGSSWYQGSDSVDEYVD